MFGVMMAVSLGNRIRSGWRNRGRAKLIRFKIKNHGFASESDLEGYPQTSAVPPRGDVFDNDSVSLALLRWLLVEVLTAATSLTCLGRVVD